MVGAVLSILTCIEWEPSTFPALSTLNHDRAWVPSALIEMVVPSCGRPPSRMKLVDATPDRLSAGVRLTVTSLLAHESEGFATADVVGAVRSICTTGALVADVVLPARSLTDALSVRSMPSPPIVEFAGQAPSIPDSASAQVQWTAT